MKKVQSKTLDRKKFFSDPVLVCTVAFLMIAMLLFVLYPLIYLLIDSVQDETTGAFTTAIFKRVLHMSGFQKAFWNTLRAGIITGVLSTAVGLLFAYVDVYVRIRSRIVEKLFNLVSVLPVVSPPFVLSLSMILLFGKQGMITKSLLHIKDAQCRRYIYVQTLGRFRTQSIRAFTAYLELYFAQMA